MPQKRSQIADDKEENIPAGKRIKTEDKQQESVTWQWEDDGHVWTDFSTDIAKKIQEAFEGKMKKTKIEINDIKFDIIFERMVQRNAKTFWERKMRVVTSENDDGGVSGNYEYEEKKGSWKKYNDGVQRLIHASIAFEFEKVPFSHQRINYTLDLKTLVETNEKKKSKRKIRNNLTIKEEENGEKDIMEEVESEEDGEKDENENTTKTTGGSSRCTVTAKKEKTKVKVKTEQKENNSEGDEKTVKSIAFKGKAPVDSECPNKDKYHVYFEGTDIYDAMLNQTNLKNNNNKFYLMQVLQSNTGKGYAVWFRWGRVGMTGQKNFINCGADLEKAKDTFFQKFFDKTKNEFWERKKFQKVAGKYDFLIMDYKATDKDEVDAAPKKKEKKIPDSKLDNKLQALVELLCNIKEMEEAVMEMKYDTKKAPLGKLTKEQIKAGYKALKKIDQCITNKKSDNELILACDAFYTRVPHCFGMRRPPVIRTKADVKMKIELLETLGDIEIALKVIRDEGKGLMNPIDQHYFNLKCEFKILDRSCEEFGIVEKYTKNTHATTHNQYKMEVLDVFAFDKCEQNKAEFKDVGNRMLLWHGSRLTNWVGIISQGLRIAPPEAPVTGYMFGKGVYFADMSSKSANYCYPTRSKNVGFVLLCEVSLGKSNDLLAADYDADQLPEGCHSTRGLGKTAPDSKDNHVMSDGLIVPIGKPVDTGVNNPNGYTLNYNEYVVYDTSQIRAKYLVQLKFNFK